ncbi:glycosyltransferase family 2 protein [Chitinophaga sp. S165]|uniref:glycosyltransferase family 2 protein n=1 Tax=Chitinophaga sp. S165 TaxID=2135462 RepID=UPI000D7173FA|nr:glycosyltransferase family 2 protein [Chitinophaga sp. S165]PWV53544.1 glycosyl transferase family 2 [Chitinophaga sp. S165]
MISVCMATYNGELFIREQINSILPQLGQGDELIISDDGSTDSTVEIIKGIEDSRIKLLHGNFRNVIKNFGNALSNVSGDFVFLADQDDIWEEKKVERSLEILKEYDLVVSDSVIVDEHLQLLYPSFFDFYGSGKGMLKNVLKSTYFGSCMAFRRSLLQQSLPFPDTREIGHDLWIGLVGEMTGKVCFLKEPLIKYRRHNTAFTSAGTGKSNRRLYVKLKGRVIMAWEITKFYLNYKLCKKG